MSTLPSNRPPADSPPRQPARPPRRRWWRSPAERAADKAAARARTAREDVEAQRARDQRDVERLEAKREKQRLKAEIDAERKSASPDSDDVRNTDMLTRIAASIATVVAGQGMWQFLERILPDVPWWLRALMFAFLEIAVITSAIRAKRNMRKTLSAGVDGMAVWGLTAVSAVLATMEASSPPEAVFRLVAPLVAAWLWERGMAIERHRIRGTGRINWRLTPERILVRLGLAEATDRTASEVDAHRRLKKVALAVKKVHQLRTAKASDRKIAAAVKRRDLLLDRAVEHTGLARDERMQWALLDLVAALGGAEALSDVLDTASGPWAMLDHPAVTGAAKHHEAVQLAEALREWTKAIDRQQDPEARAAITSMAAYIAQLEGRPALLFETADETRRQVVNQVEDEVSQDEIDELIAQLRGEDESNDDETANETSDETKKATDAMWRYWQEIVEVEQRIPEGVELANIGGCSPQYGARMRRKWMDAMDGRVRRRLMASSRRERSA